uniref:lipoprotein N-acyltransferase Lnb domain-containing protein n=1 Tax=uncultured Polaribacter sp. TaxID=174711 RepID=UPI0030D80C61
MKIKHLLFLFLFAFSKPLIAQINLSVYSEVSIITAAPGSELYEAFGHAAIRIHDPLLQIDVIYNYGMFDFNAPNFYSNFVKGKLLYSLARYNFNYFLESYKKDKRWVKQQVLNLTQEQKQLFFMYLENNALPENAAYLYDPYFNNCATKLRDITTTILGDKIGFMDDNLEQNLSFRQLMNKEIHWNTWGNFGINLALGSKLDQKATLEQYMYLPKYVNSIFNHSILYVRNQPENLIKREDLLLDFE